MRHDGSAVEPDDPPAERFERARQRQSHPQLTAFAAARPFHLDPFQIDACRALEAGRSVLVCAPTGAGKTVVGEFAVHRALTSGGKCFYTTPIKALSNQKYSDLIAEHGPGRVGLLTGDTSVNSHAPVVVMTTEVLRNMLYADSSTLAGLTAVVMDEIHYLADKFRGAVWEEVILHLPAEVQLIGLSATVSNAEEFGAWLQEVRGQVTVVVDEIRPVPLWQHMMVGRRMFDLFAGPPEPVTGAANDLAGARTVRAAGAESVRSRGEPSRTGSSRTAAPMGDPVRDTPMPAVRIDPALQRAVHDAQAMADRFPTGPARRERRGNGGDGRTRWRPPSRVDVVERLDAAGLLPAITFIFSRAGCDAAVRQCVRSGMRLTSEADRDEIRAVVDRRTAELAAADLGVLGYWDWREALERGLAAHHAGLLPVFKETVEELFVAGLVKAVFATETLALGINMPARTVVLERLTKFNGESHADLTAGEYTQLTGRAGRRGIDIEGHAVVLWSPGVDPQHVAGLASRRTYPLRSSFRPSYNMAVNLLDRLGRNSARELLEQSFAQYQADASVVGMARQVARNAEAITTHEQSMRCDRGDIREYLDLLTTLSTAEREAAKAGAGRRREQTARDLAALRRGDIISVPIGRRAGLAVVLDPGTDSDGSARPLVVTSGRWAGRLSGSEFRGAVPALGRLKLGKFTDHRSPKVRRDLASALASSGVVAKPRAQRTSTEPDPDLTALRRAVRAHPVHDCPDRDTHLQWARRWQRLTTENAALSAKVAAARGSLGLEFDRILRLLDELGYVHGDHLTDAGRTLARIWSESDLVVAECLRRGLWNTLDAAQLAAVVSTLVFESRRDTALAVRAHSGTAGEVIVATARVLATVNAREEALGLPVTREPELGFAESIAIWAREGSLADALGAAAISGTEVTAGDFVRWSRQVVDLLDQVAAVAPARLARTAIAAIMAIRRGVVAMGTA